MYEEIKRFIKKQKLLAIHENGDKEILSYDPEDPARPGLSQRCDLYSKTLIPELKKSFSSYQFTLVKIKNSRDAIESDKITNHTYILAKDNSSGEEFIIDTALPSLDMNNNTDNYVGKLEDLPLFLKQRFLQEEYVPAIVPPFKEEEQQKLLEKVRLNSHNDEDVKKIANNIAESFYYNLAFNSSVKAGNIEDFDKLFYHVDINQKDSLGNTALHYAVMRPSFKAIAKDSEQSRTEMLKQLLSRDDLDRDIINKSGRTFIGIIEKNKALPNKCDSEYGERCDAIVNAIVNSTLSDEVTPFLKSGSEEEQEASGTRPEMLSEQGSGTICCRRRPQTSVNLLPSERSNSCIVL